jgi:hypothetical protein
MTRVLFCLCVLLAMPVAHASVIVVTGTITRHGTGEPIVGATVKIKATVAATVAIKTATTIAEGKFSAPVDVTTAHFACEVSAPGYHDVVVKKPRTDPTCNVQLESLLTVVEVVERSAENGRGPGLSMLARTNGAKTLQALVIRLHIAKPNNCVKTKLIHQFDLESTVSFAMGQATATVAADGKKLTAGGSLRLNDCDSTVLTLRLQPASALEKETRIVFTLPAELRLVDKKTKKPSSLNFVSDTTATYTSVIEKLEVELVTATGAMARAELPGLKIPVSVSSAK